MGDGVDGGVRLDDDIAGGRGDDDVGGGGVLVTCAVAW